MKIKEAFAVYTGGGIWLFYGSLGNNEYFLTDDNGWTQILDANPENLEVSTFQEWQDEHSIRELDASERLMFCHYLLDWILEHPNNNGGMTEHEIETYRKYFTH